MSRKIAISLIWFPLTTFLLIGNLVALSNLATRTKTPVAATLPLRITASSDGSEQVLGATVEAGDARVLLLESFFKTHNSPMTTYGNIIVAQADKNGLDFTLLPAIAMCESNLGKHVPLKAGFNPFGAAVYTGTLKGKNFSDWSDAIIWESEYLKRTYYDKGITNLIDIGAIYAPPSVNTDNSWAKCVDLFMNTIKS
jgi:hypothetical protein